MKKLLEQPRQTGGARPGDEESKAERVRRVLAARGGSAYTVLSQGKSLGNAK